MLIGPPPSVIGVIEPSRFRIRLAAIIPCHMIRPKNKKTFWI